VAWQNQAAEKVMQLVCGYFFKLSLSRFDESGSPCGAEFVGIFSIHGHGFVNSIFLVLWKSNHLSSIIEIE
jgi:hypothetical protein